MDKEAKINLLFIIIFFGLLLVLMVYPVVAPSIGIDNNATSQVSLNISIITSIGNTTSGITFNEDVSYTFNFTINHSSVSVKENLTHVNITFPENVTFQIDGTQGVGNVTATEHAWNNITRSNTSNVLIFNGTNSSNVIIFDDGNASNPGKNYTFLWTNASIGTPGKYNITVLFMFNSSATVNRTNLSIIVNDTTIPVSINVSSNLNASDIGLNRSFANVSGRLYINVTVFDNGNFSRSNVDFNEITQVNVTVYTIASVVNASYNMTSLMNFSNQGTQWNTIINTSQFDDGVYNISLFAKDQRGNVNSTNISNVRFDNTVPTASPSCSNVNTGDSFPCSCSGSDATSDVNSSATSGTSDSPDGESVPSTTGTFTYTCIVKDMAGNSKTTTTTYTVSPAGGGGGSPVGGGGSSGYTKTVTVAQDFAKEPATTQQLAEKERIKIQIPQTTTGTGGATTTTKTTHYVGVKDIKENSVVIEITSTPIVLEIAVGDEMKVDVNDDGMYDLKVKLNSITNNKADIKIEYVQEKVPEEEKEEVTEKGGVVDEKQPAKKKGGMMWLWIALIIIIIVIVVYIVMRMNKKKW